FAVVMGSISSIWATENMFQEKVKNILIIQSYNTTQPWALDQMRGIFQNLLSPQFELTVVDLDARRNFLDEERLKIYVDYFKQLYAQSDFDIILLMDNPALDFVNQYYTELPFLHNKPIIANGINYYDETFISNIPKIKIIKEDGGAAETVLQMIKFFPDTKNIYVLNDYTTGVAVRKNLEKDFEKIADQTKEVHFIYNSNTSLSNIINEINHLPDNTLILLGSYFYDSTLTYFSYDVLASKLADSVTKPIFCLIDYSLTQNIIGGKLNSGYEQGQLLGKVALDILQQPEWTATNCISCLKSNWYFNYNALKKYHLLDKPLPKNSIIIGEPVSFFKKNKQVLTYTLGIIMVLILFISLIIYYNISLRKNVNRQTKKIKGLLNKFESFITEMPIGYVETDKNAIIRMWNKSAERIFGYAQEEAIGNSVTEMIINTKT
ncbi:MAG: PAS domain S-box protein, partial [Bacteroidales bacterium]